MFNVEDKLPTKHEEIFRFVHLSDPHLFTTSGVRIRDLLNKRAYAYFSWHLHRHAEHCEDVLAALLKDLQSTKPDHIVVTGDLTHMGLPSEFRQARKLLQALGTPSKVMVIPGNHDTYVATDWEHTFRLWSDYMASDTDQDFSGKVKDHRIFFPTLRIRGVMALIGVSTAHPTAPFIATGSIGKTQLKRLGNILDETRSKNLVRVVLIHHPPVSKGVSWRKRLTDQTEFRAIMARHGAELVLHGHIHHTCLGDIETPWGKVFSIGVPSASSLGRTEHRRARYHLFRLLRTDAGLEMQLTVKVYSPPAGCFVNEGGQRVPLPQPVG